MAIPYNSTSSQWMQIKRAIQYGQSKDVKVKITVIK
ncbi:endonuclease toxin domain-containing protein [Leeia speluncae]